jgi:S1-C subfamily serine protease/antitoxin component YwqK of YwqJK toxin-antitoxin module
MKNFFYVLIAVLSLTHSYSQQDILGYYDADFLKCSKVVAKYFLKNKPSESLNLKVFLLNGTLKQEWHSDQLNSLDPYYSPINGILKTYYDSGSLFTSALYSNSELNGMFISYYENGQIKEKCNFTDGLREGESLQYDITGKLISNEKFVKGTGNFLIFYENGNLKFSGKKIEGKKEGSYIKYLEDGSTKEIFNFTSDMLDGPYINYFDSEKKIKQVNFYKTDTITAIRLECNEYKKCKIIIENNFNNPMISQSNWTISNNENSMFVKEGLMIKSADKYKKLKNTDIDLNIPWIEYEDFTIEAEFINQDLNTDFGLYWNENQTEKSYNGFLINSFNKSFEVETFDGSIYLKDKKGISNSILNGVNSKNILTICKKGNDIYYSVNGTVIEKESYVDFKFNGKRFSIYVAPKDISKPSKIIISRYVFKDDIPYDYAQGIAEKLIKENSYTYSGNGSGFFIEKSGFIATNFHVIDGAKQIEVEIIDNNKVVNYSAELIKADRLIDLAIIKINDPKFITTEEIPYNFQMDLKPVGSSIFTLGFPYGELLGSDIKFSNGTISSSLGINDEISRFQISAPIQPGNSGGPVLDTEGNLIGVIVESLNKDLYNSENVNFAIKAPYLKCLIDVLPQKIKLASSTQLKGKTTNDQVELLKKIVVKIKTKN